MRLRFLLDEMYPAGLAEAARNLGLDVVAVQERPEWRGAPDEELFAMAREEQRTLVTENAADFLQLLAAEGAAAAGHPGLVVTTDRSLPRSGPGALGRIAAALDQLRRQRADIGLRDAVVWLSPPDDRA